LARTLSHYETEVTIVNEHGLHARPVTKFVQLANQYDSKIEVSNGELAVDGKSVMSMMCLAATRGTSLRIRAEGPDAAEAVRALAGLVASKFGEE